MRTGRSLRRVRLRGAGSRCGSRFRSAMSRFASPRSRASGRRSSAHVHDVFGLPSGARPRVVVAHEDAALTRKIAPLARGLLGDDRRLRAEPHRRRRRRVERASALPGRVHDEARDRRCGTRSPHRNSCAGVAGLLASLLDAHALGQRVRERPRGLARRIDQRGLSACQRVDALDRYARLRDVRRLRASHACVAYSCSRRAATRIRLRQAHDGLGHRDAPTCGLARLGRPRAASRRAARLQRGRRPLPPLAPRARQ